MTASRTCPRCGADLPADIRWCARCYEPVRELSPRSPVHDGDLVGSPIHERGDIPRWSRWEATATTFGPWGRIGLTVLLLVTLFPAIASGGFVYVIAFPVFASVVLKEIWAKGWYVPESDSPTTDPLSTPQRTSLGPAKHQVTFSSTKLIRWTLLIAGTGAFVYGNEGVKTGVMGLAAVWLLVWLWTSFDR
jgi:hypothetical protein